MPERDVIAAVTDRPARILGLNGEVGSLAPGACADLTVLGRNDQAAALADVNGATRPGACWEPILSVRAGRIIPAGPKAHSM
jgi:predicted amidohydrolase